MKYFLLVCSSLILSSAGSCQTIGQSQKSADSVKNAEAVNKVLDDFIDAWNKHDAKAFSMVFAEDADFTNVGGNSKHGRIEIEKHHEPSFKTKWKDSHQKIIKSKIRFIKSDVAAVDAWWELTGIKGPEGQDMPPRKGLLNFIMTKNNGTWLITVMHNMDLRDPQ
jgi:uncharacterized protein (TIGR02246 family)